MATIQNDMDVLLQAAAVRLIPAAVPSNVTVPFDQVNGSTKPSNNADVTLTAINGTLVATGGGITLSGGGAIKGGQSSFNSGNGFFLGWHVSEYKLSLKNAAGDQLTFSSAGLNIVGDITGSSNLTIGGSASFDGSTATGDGAAAVSINEGLGAAVGLRVWNGAIVKGVLSGISSLANRGAVEGSTSGTNARGVYGQASAASANAVEAWNSAGGTSLKSTGKFAIDNTTLVANLNTDLWHGVTLVSTSATGAATATFNSANKPGTNTTNVWEQKTLANGKTGYSPLWVEP
jgi:hypothetical protein